MPLTLNDWKTIIAVPQSDYTEYWAFEIIYIFKIITEKR